MQQLFNTLGFATLILCLGLIASPAMAHTAGEHQADPTHSEVDDDADFETVVRGIDTLPNLQALTERWPDAEQRLIDLAIDEERSEFIRWRATSLLGNFQSDAVQSTLVDLTGTEERRVRSMAYTLLAGAFLERGDDDLFEIVESGLSDNSEQVRHNIVRALGHSDHPGARSLLEELASSHDDPQVQRLATRSLERQ